MTTIARFAKNAKANLAHARAHTPRVTVGDVRKGLERVQAAWFPEWKDFVPAALNLCKKNLWRVRPVFDFEDLVQEAALVFYRCSRRYWRIVDPPHFMTIFRRAFINQIHTLATKRTKSASGHVLADGSAVLSNRATFDRLTASEDFYERLESADPEVQALIDRVMVETGRQWRDTWRPKFRRRVSGHRETLNEWLCRAAGLDPSETDLRAKVEQFLSGSQT